VTRILSYRQQGSPNSPIVTVLNNFGNPVDLKGHAFASILHGSFNGTLNANYVDDYTVNGLFTTGPVHIGSWTTFDLNLAYDFGARAGLLDRVQLSVSAQNLLDRDPPFVDPFGAGLGFIPIGFDSANANPLGRFVSVGIKKQW